MQQRELEEERRRAGEDILALRETIPSTLLLDQLGKAYKRGSWGYWISIVLFLNVIILGPWLLIGLSRKELEWTRYLWVSGSMAVEFVIAGFILAHQEILADHPELELNITEVGDADSIGKYATVLVLPTLVINEQVVCSGRHAGKYEIAEWLLNAMKGNDHVEP